MSAVTPAGYVLIRRNESPLLWRISMLLAGPRTLPCLGVSAPSIAKRFERVLEHFGFRQLANRLSF